jgi:hypothetical protein
MSYETDRIEADIQQSRHRLNDTIDALGSKLSPGQILDEVMGLAQGQAGQFTANLGRQVRDNPLPAVLIGAGVLAYIVNQNKERHASDAGAHWHKLEEARWRTARLSEETDEAFNERMHAAYATALDLKHEAGEAIDAFKARVARAVAHIDRAAHNAGHRVGAAFSQAKHFAGDQARHAGEAATSARHAAANFYGDNPLVSGAIALAIGALIGAGAPLSSVEKDMLSDAADGAAKAGADAARRGADAVEKAVSSVH